VVEIAIDTALLNGEWFGTAPSSSPTIVMLHEGLGSVTVWRDFPERLAEVTNTRVFAYSRAGHGFSSPPAYVGAVDSLHREALQVLPKLLREIGFQRGVLLGHSDGASIATIYAGHFHEESVVGLVLIEPHFNIEAKNIRAIRELTSSFATSELRHRLARHHSDVDTMFANWSRMWLDPDFQSFDITAELASIRIPILFIKSADDPYSTMLQVNLAESNCVSPLQTVIIPGNSHSPYKARPEETLRAIADFKRKLFGN
jgi:pimeloyl-ACP methyl ester carboxylesterase